QTYFYAMYRSFKERKMKKLTLLAVILALFFILPYTAYAVRTPRWSFTVSTDKTIYMLGENVTITATLTNNGYITHSFTSIDKVPIQIYVQYSWFSIWYSDSNAGKTEFSIGPRESIQRTVVWNQTTWEHFGWGVSKLVPITTTGEYYVYAAIFDADGDSKLFKNWVKITIEE
ncbi:MAG: hypothetical protein OEX01_09370, partial [Candidatus Bathyarchaeota archaeon]|nr:hypothetical protein [Candidatus Bathyarchaeota archaeon]